jgi:type II secretory pathway pseudopilin PulG
MTDDVAQRDRGFMLLELIVSVAITAVVMASLTVFFVQSTMSVRKHSDQQAATQFAVASMEYVSLLSGSTVLLGRTKADVLGQWRSPGAAGYLDPAVTELAWEDPGTPAASTVPGLPTTAQTITVGGAPTKFQRHWYVGQCWQATSGGDCVVVPDAARATLVPMYRIVVSIVWRSRDCAAGQCEYVAALLTEQQIEDPVFE